MERAGIQVPTIPPPTPWLRATPHFRTSIHSPRARLAARGVPVSHRPDSVRRPTHARPRGERRDFRKSVCKKG